MFLIYGYRQFRRQIEHQGDIRRMARRAAEYLQRRGALGSWEGRVVIT